MVQDFFHQQYFSIGLKPPRVNCVGEVQEDEDVKEQLTGPTIRYAEIFGCNAFKPNQSIPTVPKTVRFHVTIALWDGGLWSSHISIYLYIYTYIYICKHGYQVEIGRFWGSIHSTVTVGCRRVEPSYPAGSPRHRVPVHHQDDTSHSHLSLDHPQEVV